MACCEFWCNEKCGWHEFSNKHHTMCPDCGGRIGMTFDEPVGADDY